jgi:hypothetical protein
MQEEPWARKYQQSSMVKTINDGGKMGRGREGGGRAMRRDGHLEETKQEQLRKEALTQMSEFEKQDVYKSAVRCSKSPSFPPTRTFPRPTR